MSSDHVWLIVIGFVLGSALGGDGLGWAIARLVATAALLVLYVRALRRERRPDPSSSGRTTGAAVDVSEKEGRP